MTKDVGQTKIFRKCMGGKAVSILSISWKERRKHRDITEQNHFTLILMIGGESWR